MNALRASFAPYWESIQRTLFPRLEQALGPLTEKQQQLVQTLEVIRIERLIPRYFRAPGRPPKDRAAMARAFVAKAVYDLPSTRALLDRLAADVALRRLCGWERKFEVPSESVFSRAFAEFADTQLPQRVHEALIRETHHDRLVGHLSRDSTAIEVREKPAAKEKPPPPPKRKRGRPKKGEERPKVLTRLERQPTMNLPAMLDDLPTACDVGTKKNSKGYTETCRPLTSPAPGGGVRSSWIRRDKPIDARQPPFAVPGRPRAGRVASPTPPDGCGTAFPVILADRRRPATSMQRPVGRPGAPSADNATPIAERRGSGSVQSGMTSVAL